VIAAAAMFGVTYGLSAPLIALDLSERGFSEMTIGLNAAMHAVGVLLVAPVLPRLAARFGQRRLTIVALLASACLLTLFPLVALTLLWFPLRAALGAASELLFTLTESWSNELSPESARGRVMATYTAALSLGFAAGPALLAYLGSGDHAYLAGAALALAATLPLLWPRLRVPEREKAQPLALLRSLRLAPLALAATLLNAAVETSGLSFITLYATRMGWTETASMHLITTLLLGAIVLQLPIGWLADRLPARGLVLMLAMLAAVGACDVRTAVARLRGRVHLGRGVRGHLHGHAGRRRQPVQRCGADRDLRRDGLRLGRGRPARPESRRLRHGLEPDRGFPHHDRPCLRRLRPVGARQAQHRLRRAAYRWAATSRPPRVRPDFPATKTAAVIGRGRFRGC